MHTSNTRLAKLAQLTRHTNAYQQHNASVAARHQDTVPARPVHDLWVLAAAARLGVRARHPVEVRR